MPAETQVLRRPPDPDSVSLERSPEEMERLAQRLGLPRPPRRGRPRRGGWSLWVKRTIDFNFALALLLLAGPVMMLIALAIRLSSPGPVLFRQLRIGHSPEWAEARSGLPRAFEILKFRTMKVDTPAYQTTPATHDDDRITTVGRFLRKTSLDELPQLFNVLRGQMAFIGPRPEMPFVVKSYGVLHRRRLAVMPGITGLWQLYGIRSKPIHSQIEFDLYYIDQWSLGLDLFVIRKTFNFVLKGGNV